MFVCNDYIYMYVNVYEKIRKGMYKSSFVKMEEVELREVIQGFWLNFYKKNVFLYYLCKYKLM